MTRFPFAPLEAWARQGGDTATPIAICQTRQLRDAANQCMAIGKAKR